MKTEITITLKGLSTTAVLDAVERFYTHYKLEQLAQTAGVTSTWGEYNCPNSWE